MDKPQSYQFAVFRIYLGIYLASLFITSFGSSTALWSSEGLVPQASLNLTFGLFPNVLNFFDSPLQIEFFLLLLIAISILFTLGLYRQWTALLLWYGLTCLLNRNNMIINPSIHYNGWLLIGCAIIPKGEPWSLSKSKKEWQLPSELVTGAWVIFSVGYFLSGFDKLYSASWMDGTAILKIVTGPLGNTLGSYLLEWMPGGVLNILTWSVIALEMLCLPLSIIPKTRKWAWVAATFLQLNILLFLSLPVIAMGMVAIHLFLFNPYWFSLEPVLFRLMPMRYSSTLHKNDAS